MGFNNPDWTWSELEATLSGRAGRDGRAPGSPSWNAGGDSPAWGRKRQPYVPPGELVGQRRAGSVAYAELHCHSNYSFLDGASHPEELVTEAARLGLEALALTDHDGLYGIVRFAEAARTVGLPTIFGSELTLTGDRGSDGDGHAPHLVVLADGTAGYARLARAISLGQLAGSKGAPRFEFDEVAATVAGHCWVLTGCRHGAVPRALVAAGPAAAGAELQRLIAAFGRDRVLVELWDHGNPLDSARNDALAELAHRHGVDCVATTNAHYAHPRQHRLAGALAAIGERSSLDELDPWLPAAATAHLRSGAEQQRRFRRYPGVVERAAYGRLGGLLRPRVHRSRRHVARALVERGQPLAGADSDEPTRFPADTDERVVVANGVNVGGVYRLNCPASRRLELHDSRSATVSRWRDQCHVTDLSEIGPCRELVRLDPPTDPE